MTPSIIHTVLDALFPLVCVYCRRRDSALCKECSARIDEPVRVRKDDVLAAASYADPVVQAAIRALKYDGYRAVAEPLGELLYRRLFRSRGGGSGLEHLLGERPLALVPIPLSKKRLRERGFNQAALIAGAFLKLMLAENPVWEGRAAVFEKALKKVRHTASQVSLGEREKRLENVRGSMRALGPEGLSDRDIILIDDVSTTGATMAEARRALRAEGVGRVLAVVVAR